MLQALELIKRYKAEHPGNTRYYACGEHVPVDGVIPKDLVELLYKTDKRGRARIQRTVYECGVFQTLRDKLRCKEIWVVGADKWRDPDQDLPNDFEARRAENYEALRKPLDPKVFTSQMREEMAAALADLNDELPNLAWVDISERPKAGPIILTDLDPVPEPRNLRRLKAEVKDRWGTVPLLDMLTETALRTGCLDAFTPIGTRSDIEAAKLFQRLLLLVYAYGTTPGSALWPPATTVTPRTSCVTSAAARTIGSHTEIHRTATESTRTVTPHPASTPLNWALPLSAYLGRPPQWSDSSVLTVCDRMSR